jgi:hypothetical protein
MTAQPGGEEWAASLVRAGPKVAGGPWFVFLCGAGAVPVELGPYENPALAEADAGKLRQFLAAAVRAAPPQ